MIEDNYEDIINLPHYEPKKHPRMSSYNRAAQFAPFAALTGYEEQVKETARLTDKRVEIDEGLRNLINSKLQIIDRNIKSKPEVTITYFVKDKKKNGGYYTTIKGNAKKVDSIKEIIVLSDKTKIDMKDILTITGEILKNDELD